LHGLTFRPTSAATIGFMTDIMLKQLTADPLGHNAVVLVFDADTDDGYGDAI
jgi:hypothetical protein